MDIVARFLIFSVLVSTFALQEEGCRSPQYVTVGKTANINCLFHPGFYGLFWYNSTDIIKGEAILNFRESVKSGIGYTLGKLDIHNNGSLIIKNVSLNDDGLYTVVRFYSPTNYSSPITVRVVTVVEPHHQHPFIENCSNGDVICLKQIKNHPFEVSCRVRNSKPSLDLYWAVRTLSGDRNISFQSFKSTKENVFSTRVTTTDVSHQNSSLALIVCKAIDPYLLLQKDESYLLMQRNNYDTITNSLKSDIRYFELNSRMILECSKDEILYLIWRKQKSASNTFENIIYTVFTETNVTKELKDGYDVDKDGSLLLARVTSMNGGLYNCIFSDGITDDQITYEVIVYAKPVPNYPIVEGCNNEQYCVLEARQRGNLTCTVSGIRPPVQLEWRILDKQYENIIPLRTKEQIITENGEKFDVSVSAFYEIHTEPPNRFTFECRVVGPNSEFFDLSTKLDLLFLNEKHISATEETSKRLNALHKIILIISILAVTFSILAYAIFRLRQKKERKKKTKTDLDTTRQFEEEALPMMVNENRGKDELNIENEAQTDKERRRKFVKQLKEKYEDLYRSVKPIPYVRDKMYTIEEVFVEGGIQLLKSKDKFTGHEEWERLTSHNDIFKHHLGVEPSRHILEGEPGYGKSMLALQIAFAWCLLEPSSPFSKIDILIVLRLRQLEGFASVFEAIKVLLLPKDSDFSEQEIQGTLNSSKSGMIILDGLDEYPDKDKEVPSHILDIIKGNMFRQYEVLLTTRTYCLPKKYPRRTKRERLTGFDDFARKCYLRKAVVGNDDERVDAIEKKLRENPVLFDLCQVPLCFVLFAHTIHEKEDLAKCDSVTEFFHFVISCFHSHMRNKMEDENVKRFELFEDNHTELGEAAFDGLIKYNEHIIWEKEELLEYFDDDLYKQYVRTGILLEEESLQIKSKPVAASEHIQYKTKVYFYHQLFCEWYASHYLVQYIKDHENDCLLPMFKTIDPFKLQYVYRFACGRSSTAARHIINYLKTNDETKYFAILCTLEDTRSFNGIKEATRQLCNKVEVTESQSRLLRRTVIQLLEIACNNKITVKLLSIRNCFHSFDGDKSIILIEPDYSLSALKTLKELNLSERGRELTVEETKDILKYISLCAELDTLRLYHCLMPRLDSTIPCLSVLQSRAVKVTWYPTTSVYRLNLETGTWGFKESSPLTSNEYSKLIREFRLTYQETAWQKKRVSVEPV